MSLVQNKKKLSIKARKITRNKLTHSANVLNWTLMGFDSGKGGKVSNSMLSSAS